MENGRTNGKGKIWNAEPEKKATGENSIGPNPGIRKSKLYPRKRMKMAMTSRQTHLMDQKLKSATARNGEGTRRQAKNGMRNGAKTTRLAKKRNGATNGRSIWLQETKKERIGDKHTMMIIR